LAAAVFDFLDMHTSYTSTCLVKHRDIIDGRQFLFFGKSVAFQFWFTEKVWSKPMYIFVYWNNGLLVSL